MLFRLSAMASMARRLSRLGPLLVELLVDLVLNIVINIVLISIVLLALCSLFFGSGSASVLLTLARGRRHAGTRRARARP